MDHPEEIKIIKQMINLKQNGFNYAQIAKILNAQGLHSKTGLPWKRWSIQKILKRKKNETI
ncbi:MAG: recombinase family protein [Deltaproteobacteria bacterium]|nr:recombinase family protein [Deltaproteobacteria bacterium]